MVPKILRRSSLEELIGLSRSSIYAMMANNEFPKPVKLGRRAVGWREEDIQNWLEHLQDQFIDYTHQQTELRREADLWSQLVQEHLAHKDEVTIKEAFELCFPQDSIDTRPNPKQITQQDQRRMANCLLAAGFERNGKFSSGKHRNQVRFTRASG